MPNSLIFITGASGFIGSHVVAASLKAGYRVRLSIRKAEQEQTLKELFPGFSSKIETVVVPDITSTAAFRSALDDVDYIFHLASPMPGKGSEIGRAHV